MAGAGGYPAPAYCYYFFFAAFFFAAFFLAFFFAAIIVSFKVNLGMHVRVVGRSSRTPSRGSSNVVFVVSSIVLPKKFSEKPRVVRQFYATA